MLFFFVASNTFVENRECCMLQTFGSLNIQWVVPHEETKFSNVRGFQKEDKFIIVQCSYVYNVHYDGEKFVFNHLQQGKLAITGVNYLVGGGDNKKASAKMLLT